MARSVEQVLNVRLAQQLGALGLAAHPENRQPGSNKQIDVDIDLGSWRCAIEAEIGNRAGSLADARKRAREAGIGLVVAHSVIAVSYPAGLSAGRFTADTNIEWAVLPSSDFTAGSVWQLAGVIRRTRPTGSDPDDLAAGLDRALALGVEGLGSAQRDDLARAVDAAWASGTKVAAAAKRALLVVAAAAMFHARLVGNTICADLIDYLHRDWHHIGKQRHLDTRLFHYMEIGSLPASPRLKNRHDQVVINLQSSEPDRYRTDAITEILSLLESRYQLWEIALLHRTKTAASSMLERALMEVFEEFRSKSVETIELFPEAEVVDEKQLMHEALLEAVIEVSDEALYGSLASGLWLSSLPGNISMPEVSISLLRRLQHRMLYKEFARADTYTHGLDAGQKQRISAFLAGSKAGEEDEESGITKFDAAEHRLASVHNLEDDFQLPQGSLSMYCVPFGLGRKLANAKILIQDDIWTLRDAGSLRRIDGGHLAAQLERFHGLWRASLFISEDARRTILEDDLGDELRAAFTIGVLGLKSGENSMRKIAANVAHKRESGRQGPRRRMRHIPPDLDQDAIDEAAVSDPTVSGYPSGSPRIISFLEEHDE